MNVFTLLTLMFGAGTIVSFISGVGAMLRHGQSGHRPGAEWMLWRVIFQAAVFGTILAAPLAATS
jgi:hypothetical protein